MPIYRVKTYDADTSSRTIEVEVATRTLLIMRTA
jgi:hypothetical protein